MDDEYSDEELEFNKDFIEMAMYVQENVNLLASPVTDIIGCDDGCWYTIVVMTDDGEYADIVDSLALRRAA